MTAQITELLSTPDGYETARDALATILAEEIASQQSLAGANAADYALDVYVERFAPIEKWVDEASDTPVATVWLARYTSDDKRSTVNSNRGRATYHIDVFAQARDANNPAGGHIAGDLLARQRLHRALRLIRQILMSGQYTYLDSARGAAQYVFARSVREIEVHEARKRDERSAVWISTARMTLDVSLKVDQPQNLPVDWDGIDITQKRLTGTPDGKVLAQLSIDETP